MWPPTPIPGRWARATITPAFPPRGAAGESEPRRGFRGFEVRNLTRTAANDDRVAIGSGSHAVPYLSEGCVGLCGGLGEGDLHSPHRVPRGRKRHLYP